MFYGLLGRPRARNETGNKAFGVGGWIDGCGVHGKLPVTG